MKTKTCIDTDSLKVASENSESYLYWNSTGCPVTLRWTFSSTSFPCHVQMWKDTYQEGHSSPSPAAEWLERCNRSEEWPAARPAPAAAPLQNYQALSNVSEWDQERKDSCRVTRAPSLPQARYGEQHYQQCLIKDSKIWQKHQKLL